MLVFQVVVKKIKKTINRVGGYRARFGNCHGVAGDATIENQLWPVIDTSSSPGEIYSYD